MVGLLLLLGEERRAVRGVAAMLGAAKPEVQHWCYSVGNNNGIEKKQTERRKMWCCGGAWVVMARKKKKKKGS